MGVGSGRRKGRAESCSKLPAAVLDLGTAALMSSNTPQSLDHPVGLISRQGKVGVREMVQEASSPSPSN